MGGLYASYFRFVPALYLLAAFVFLPGICLAMSALFKASVAGGVFVLLLLLGAVGFFEVAWWKGIPLNKAPLDGTPVCFRVLSKEQREEGVLALEAANAAIMGMSVEGAEKSKNVGFSSKAEHVV